MLSTIIKNIDNTYEHLYIIENKLIPFHIDKDGISISDISYINKLISKLKYNNMCEYIMDFNSYKVYYNSSTGFKHFILNNVENYDMFLKYNGRDARYYRSDKKKDIYSRMINVLGASIILTTASFSTLLALKYDTNVNFSTIKSHTLVDIISMYQNDEIDYTYAINSINSSNLPDDVKKIVSDDDFLKLIFSYYADSPLKYSASLKFSGLKTLKYEDAHNGNDSIMGYYEPMIPNVLNYKIGRGEVQENQTIIHEFIHLLQAEGSPYYYLNEAVAELMTAELLDSSPTTYFDAVENLKLLINIVGPMPIYELSFGGDDNSLNDILRTYLPTKDIIKLKYYLQKSGEEVNNDHKIHVEIQTILYKLYQNKYGKPIKEDKNIISVLNDYNNCFPKNIYTYDKRKFLIPSRMNEKEKIIIFGPSQEILAQNGYLIAKKCYKKSVRLDEKLYKTLINHVDMEFNGSITDMQTIINYANIEFKENLNTNGIIAGKVVDIGGKVYYKHLDVPINVKDYEIFSFRKLPSKDYSIKEAIQKGYVNAYKVSLNKERTSASDKEFIYYESNNPDDIVSENFVKFTVDGIKERFSNQYDELVIRMTDINYKLS